MDAFRAGFNQDTNVWRNEASSSLDKLDSFLAGTGDASSWRKIIDDIEDEEVELTKEKTKLIRRMLKEKAPHADFDPHAPYVDQWRRIFPLQMHTRTLLCPLHFYL